VLTDQPRPPVAVLATVPGVTDVQVFGDRAHVRFADGTATAAAAAVAEVLGRSGMRATSVRPIPASLEDVFIDLIVGAPHGGGEG
jgi:hypothetical protein